MNEFRKYPPSEYGKIEFSLPSIEKAKLGNNNLYYVHKSNLPICQLDLMINSGSKSDPQGKDGLAHLTAMLLDEGAGEFDALELSDEFEKLGTIFSISSDKDTIHLSLLSMEEYFERSLELLSMVLFKPKFTNEDFQREKQKLLSKIIQSKDNPSNLAHVLFDKLIYTNSGYSKPIIGTKESINSISLDDIREYHKNVILNGAWDTICVVNYEKSKLENLIAKHLSHDISHEFRGTQIESNTDLSPTKIYLVNHEGAAQTELMIGHCGTKRDEGNYFARHLLNSILGGQFTSRINLNLREDKGYTYGAGSTFSYNKNAGSFYVSTSVQSEVTGNAINEILYELNNIQKGVSEKELDFAKSSLVKRFPAQFETYSQVSNNLANIIIHGLPFNYYNLYLSNLQKTSIEEVNQSAHKYIHNNNLVIVCVGNSEMIKKQLLEKYDYEIVELDKDGIQIDN
jgi:zinc protease